MSPILILITEVSLTLLFSWLAINLLGYEIISTKKKLRSIHDIKSEKDNAFLAMKRSFLNDIDRVKKEKNSSVEEYESILNIAKEETAKMKVDYEARIKDIAGSATVIEDNIKKMSRDKIQLQADNKKLRRRIELLERNLEKATGAPAPVLEKVNELALELKNAAAFSKQFPRKSQMAKHIKDRLNEAVNVETA